MTLRTGTSKGGRVYRYYTCSNCATKGKTACNGRSIPMQKLDTLVTEHLLERLFNPQRVAVILASLSTRRAEQATALNARIAALQREMIDAEDKLKRLYCLVEDGLTDLDEVLKDRLNTLKTDRDRAKAALGRAKENSGSQIQIDPALIERFGRTMRESFSTGSVPFRKAYLRSLIDVIEVDDHHVRIKGSKDLLEKAVLASQNGQDWCSQTSTRWRARRDSNSRPLPSENAALCNQHCNSAAFREARVWNVAKTSCVYADVLRTSADVLCGLALVVGMVMPVDARQRLHAHRQEARRLPEIGASLHQPGGCGVA
jgi:site-specific DNA recombinase